MGIIPTLQTRKPRPNRLPGPRAAGGRAGTPTPAPGSLLRLLVPALECAVAPTGSGSLPAGPRCAPGSPGASPVAMDVGVWLRGGEASPAPREPGRALPLSPGGWGSAASKMVTVLCAETLEPY